MDQPSLRRMNLRYQKQPKQSARRQSIDEALNQAPDTVHYNAKTKRTAFTLFAGNLDFLARDTDIFKLLRKCNRSIQVDQIAIPNHNRRHKGYAFIILSWVQQAQVNPAHICNFYSDMIHVN